jgi:hypothetical protein
MSEINILGTNIRVERKSQRYYNFGEFGMIQKVEGGFPALGFANALADVKDGQYPVMEAGFNSHMSDELLSEGLEKAEAAYVNFAMITDARREKLAKMGVVELPERTGWLVLDAKNGRYFGNKELGYANPKKAIEVYLDRNLLPEDYVELSKEDQKEARRIAYGKVHPDVWDRNNHEWRIVHKQKGVNLVRLLLAEKVRVNVDAGEEDWMVASFEEKVVGLWTSYEDRREAKAETVQRLEDQRKADIGAFYVRKYSEQEERANVVAKEVGIDPQTLVKTPLQYLRPDGSVSHFRIYHATLEGAKAAILFTQTAGLTIVPFPG